MPGYKPLKFTHTEEDKVRGLCGCKMNSVEKGPFCDGSHKTIDFDKIIRDAKTV
jgi:CDGSH-type Zn-finger protein